MNRNQKLNLAKIKSEQTKPENLVYLTKKQQTELLQKFAELANVISEFQFTAPELDLSVLEPVIKRLEQSVDKVNPADIVKQFKEAIEQIKPQVNIDVPKAETKVIKEDDIFAEYKPADSDERKEKGQKFYGFVSATGKWFILREQGVNEGIQTYRYATGSTGYENAWLNRSIQNYKYFYEVSL